MNTIKTTYGGYFETSDGYWLWNRNELKQRAFNCEGTSFIDN